MSVSYGHGSKALQAVTRSNPNGTLSHGVGRTVSVHSRASHHTGRRKSLVQDRVNVKILPEEEEESRLERSNTESQLSTVQRFQQQCSALCDDWRFAVLTTVLVLYALFGDDFRLAAFPKDFDIAFDILTITSILVFFTDIIAASIGKDEYFGGFFFMLDIVSTVSMFLDITWISSAIFCQDPSGSAIKSGTEAGRQGARASRTVRIIRLIRLVKLYKTYRAAVEKREASKRQKELASRKRSSSFLAPGQDLEAALAEFENSRTEDELGSQEFNSENDDKPPPPPPQPASVDPETRVGKKLSEMTTRRVIILVLVMLFCMPYVDTEAWGFQEQTTSANMGVEFVYRRLHKWCALGHGQSAWCLDASVTEAANFDPSASETLSRHQFESELLFYLHDHNCNGVAYTMFWFGYRSKQLENSMGVSSAQSYLGETLAPLNQDRLLEGYATSECGADWDGRFFSGAWSKGTGPLRDGVGSRLCEPYREVCNDFVGVSLGEKAGSCSIDEELRCSEYSFYVPLTRPSNTTDQLDLLFVFDTRGETRVEAWLSVLQTIFICFAVGIGAMTFSNDANQLLLNPIERMISKMQTIKDNPLEAMRLGDMEYRREQIELAKRKEMLLKKHWIMQLIYKLRHRNRTREPMETVILEKTIIKLGGLLALGFGEAGADVIGQNMKGQFSAGINPTCPGQTVNVIIGFCSIRHFAEATDVLKEDVMLFVNFVAEIVHGCVDDCHGCPNRNFGNGFLLVWRLSILPAEQHSKLADMALLSFVQIVAAANKSPALAEYRDHPALAERVPGFQVQLGFGLHCGWAVEGAIGSEMKIDAAYISPNIGIASSLESATHPYGVWLLLSHFLVQLCSMEMNNNCRLIDQCTVTGIRQPVRLYTLDLDPSRLDVEQKSNEIAVRNRFKARQIREQRKQEKWSDEFDVATAFEADEDIQEMRATFSAEFFQRYWTAYRNYEAGEWYAARDMLYTCHYSIRDNVSDLGTLVPESDWPTDGPTRSLLRFMAAHDFEAPTSWEGHRPLGIGAG